MIYARDSSEKKHLLIDVLLSQGVEGQRVLVFVATKREADMLEEFLYHERFPATSIHGDRTQTEREQALKSFRAGREKVLVATDVCARGIDIPDVAMVINYDMPNSIDDYVHRIGRTGRAGNNGNATSFVTPKDAKICKDLEKVLVDARQEVPTFLDDLARQGGGFSGRAGASYGRKDRGGGGGGGWGNDRYGGGWGSSGGGGGCWGGSSGWDD